MSKTVTIDDETYEFVMKMSGEKQSREKRDISIAEMIRELVNVKKQ